MRNKIYVALIMAIMMSMGVVWTSFGYVDPSMTEESTEIYTEASSEESTEYVEPSALTPEGNLSLVDDISKEQSEDKQFITVVTKAGNYFYIIVDRAADGENTVHFLNLVDESDILSLMDEEEVTQYESATKSNAIEETTVAETKAESTNDNTKKRKPNVLPIVIMVLAIVGGAGAYVFIRGKKNKKDDNKPDPDAEYNEYEDEDDYEVEEESIESNDDVIDDVSTDDTEE